MATVEAPRQRILFSDTERRKDIQLEKPESVPLGELGIYILTQFPSHLTEIRMGERSTGGVTGVIETGISDQFRQICGALNTEGTARESLSGLMFLYNGIANSGGKPGSLLHGLVKEAARDQGRLPTLSYADVIFYNSLRGTPHLFTEGQIGATELDFYETHLRIEEDNAIILPQYDAAIKDLSQRGGTAVKDAVAMIEETFPYEIDVLEHMHNIGHHMRIEDFTAFRGYFKGYPGGEEGFKGASGAFAESPQRRYMIKTGIVPESTEQYITQFIDYFPQDGQQLLLETLDAVKNGYSFRHMVERLGNPPELVEVIIKSLQYELDFLKSHSAAVGAQIPGALEGEVHGTGGFGSVGQLFSDKIVPLFKLLTHFKSLS